MGKRRREIDEPRGGGPGRSAPNGHVEPERSGNKLGQRQAGAEGGQARAAGAEI